MSSSNRLTEVFQSSKEIPFDDSSKFILFSDCHRGDNSWADDFAQNQTLFFHALDSYFESGFTYIELGDGDELWENASFKVIRKAHSDVFWKMSQFHNDNRFYFIWGNHNRKWNKPRNVEKHLYYYYDEREKCNKPLYKGINIHEGLILRHQVTGNKIFLTHGHQADLLNDTYWWFGRFVVRNLWKYLQIFGARDPTSMVSNSKKRLQVEKDLIQWAKTHESAVIAGHTHRPEFPAKDNSCYFNTGSSVHPRFITGIEIENGEIALVKWFMNVKPDGILFIDKEVKAGPKRLQDLHY